MNHLINHEQKNCLLMACLAKNKKLVKHLMIKYRANIKQIFTLDNREPWDTLTFSKDESLNSYSYFNDDFEPVYGIEASVLWQFCRVNNSESIDFIKFLIENGANPHTKSEKRFNSTPLM
jgi:hypothetical protein